ncbi:MAG: two-component sensor histidine kinase [Streptococcaceae bacterium]|jgi:two-component system phosphate regulon sensor histidine kinase PhoR|nr:two-component sensor histidine kinase [Streptococcaceae bacterium]
MKFNKESKREISFVLGILLVLFISSIWIGNYFFRVTTTNQQSALLQDRLTLFLNYFPFDEVVTNKQLTPEQTAIIHEYITGNNDRLTLYDQEGTPFFDSINNLKDSMNTEEINALKRGASVGIARRTTTDNEPLEMMYVALSVNQNGKSIGYIRIAEQTSGFARSIEIFQTYLIVVLSIVFVILAILAIRLIQQKNEPLETILPILKKNLKDPSKRRSILNESSNMNELYDTINQLSSRMSSTYQAYISTEEQFYRFINQLMIGVFFINKEGLIELANPALEKLLAQDALKEKNYLSAFANTPSLSLLIQQAMNNKEDVFEEIRLSEPSGKDLELSLRYIHDENSDIRLIGSAYDLTRIRQLERMQKDFVGNVSHELKTPVTSLIGFTETLLDGAMEDQETTKMFLEIIQKDAQRLDRLIQEILTLSRDTHPYEVEKQEIHLFTFMVDLMHGYKRKIEEKQLTIEIVGDESLKYQTQLEIFQPIIKNLFENAVNYTLENGHILLSYTFVQNELVITVKDSGIGIEPQNKARIFERFYRVDKARARQTGGTGLGLSIVENNTRLLGGKVTLESQIGVGSIFKVYLPK